MLILNEEAAEYARMFEKTERENGLEDNDELNSDEQIAIYTVTKMYMKDSAFRLFMHISVQTFAEAALSDKVPQLIDLTTYLSKKMSGAK